MNTQLKVSNYKCFENQEVTLKNLTVLAGANSVGKSSVVQSLLLSRIVIDRLRALQQLESTVNWKGELSIPLNNTYKLALGTSQEVINRDATDDIIRFSMSENSNEFKVELFASQEKAKFDLTLIDCQNSVTENDTPLSILANEFYYLNAERRGPRLSHEVGSLEFLQTGYEGEYAIQVFERLKDESVEESRAYDINERSTYSMQVPLWMNYITPGVDINVPILYEKVRTAELAISGSSPTNVGFGVSYVLPIVLNGLLAQKGSMYIIENPEAHLHPSGQSRIGYFLAKVAAAGVQVVIETHSEHIINGIRLASAKSILSPKDIQINFFKRENNQIKVDSISVNDAGNLSSYPKGFFDQVQRDNMEMIKIKQNKNTL
jgi:predicted ATPase